MNISVVSASDTVLMQVIDGSYGCYGDRLVVAIQVDDRDVVGAEDADDDYDGGLLPASMNATIAAACTLCVCLGLVVSVAMQTSQR